VKGGYNLNVQNMLKMPLDYWAIIERLGEIEEYPLRISKNDYYVDYADLFHELSNLSAVLYTDLMSLVYRLNFSWSLPRRKLAQTNMESAHGAAWFNTAAALLEETDMAVLLDNEGVYDTEKMENEQQKRKRAFMALTKEMQYMLFTEVFNFLMCFIKLSLAFEAICGSIDEMERLNSLCGRNDVPTIPQAVYL